jgi:hypothetical protein
MRNLLIVVTHFDGEQQMSESFNTPQFKKTFAGYAIVLSIALMGASWMRAEHLPKPDEASFVGTTPAAASEQEEAPTF